MRRPDLHALRSVPQVLCAVSAWYTLHTRSSIRAAGRGAQQSDTAPSRAQHLSNHMPHFGREPHVFEINFTPRAAAALFVINKPPLPASTHPHPQTPPTPPTPSSLPSPPLPTHSISSHTFLTLRVISQTCALPFPPHFPSASLFQLLPLPPKTHLHGVSPHRLPHTCSPTVHPRSFVTSSC